MQLFSATPDSLLRTYYGRLAHFALESLEQDVFSVSGCHFLQIICYNYMLRFSVSVSFHR